METTRRISGEPEAFLGFLYARTGPRPGNPPKNESGQMITTGWLTVKKLRQKKAMPKKSLVPYDVIMRISAGGLGEAFRARDTRLNREVAIPVLSKQQFASVNYSSPEAIETLWDIP